MNSFSALSTTLQRLSARLLGNDDEVDEIMDEEGLPRYRPDLVAQCLDNPLVDTPLLKIRAVLEDRIPHRRVRPTANHQREAQFVSWMKGLFPDALYKAWSARATIRFINHLRRHDEEHDMESWKAPTEIWQTFMSNWSSSVRNSTDTAPTLSTETKAAWNSWREIQLAWNKRRSDSLNRNPSPFGTRIAGKMCLLTSHLIAWEEKPGLVIYGSADMFLAVHDAMQARYCAHLALDVLKNPLSSHQLTHDLLDSQFQWQEAVVLRYGNLGYEIVKAPEALWKCYSSRLSGGSYEDNDAFSRMVEKTRGKERKLKAKDNFSTDLLVALITSVTEVEVAVEMSGLIKTSGHPIIDPITSGESSKTFGKAPDMTLPSARNDCVYTLCHLILKNFIIKESRWPELFFSRAGTKLESLEKSSWLDLTDESYPLEDWEFAQFGKICEFDYHEDYLPLIKDKSCSPPLSLLKTFYEQKGARRSLRRLLLRVIESPDIDTRQLIWDFQNDIIDPEDMLILLYPKECEFKLAARMFCMLSLKFRLFFSIVQENIKESVFKYLPYTSMVMSNAELQETLLKMTGPVGDDSLFIEIDLSRWNLCFRDNLVKPIGERMDAMFGLRNVFGRSHELFHKSVICTLVADSNVEPLNHPVDMRRESPNFWTEHEGGFEGIDQATWTVATIPMIYKALRNERVRFKLLGQGDNQTLAIARLPGNTEPMHVFANRIMAKIEQACRELNHEAKPDEFINSTSQLTYSKVFYVNGRCYPMTLKYASKISTVTSSDIVTFSDAVGAIFSSAVGAAMNAQDPLRVWLLAMIHANQFFADCSGGISFFGRRHMVASLPRDASTRKLLLTVPSVLGGLPISIATSFICRNEPDPLTSSIAFLQALGLSETNSYLLGLTKPDLFNPKPKLEMLIMDPFALPFISPASPATLMHQEALPLVRNAANRDISQLVNWATSQESELLMSALSSIRPFFPVVLRDLFDVSALGKAEELQKMFTLTRTFIQAAKSTPIEDEMRDADSRFVATLKLRLGFALSQNKGRLPRQSSSRLAQKLRTRWGVDLGVIQGVEAEHPLDHACLRSKTKKSGVTAHFVGNIRNWRTTRGPARIYLGGKTRERRIASSYELKPVPALSSLKKLVLASTAGEMTEDVWNVMRYICSTRTPHTLESLCEVLPRTTGGIIAHRYESLQASGMIGPVGNLSHGAFLMFSSDQVDGVSGGKIDYPLAFQQYYSYLSALGRYALFDSDVSADSIIITLSSSDMDPLIQDQLSVASISDLPVLNTDLVTNRFCYVPEVEIVMGSSMYHGRLIDTSKALSRPSLFLAGAILTEQLTSPLSRARLEMNDDDKPNYSKLDVAVFSSIGSKAVHTALLISGAWISTFNYFRLMGNLPTRFSATSLVYRVARNLSGYMTSNVIKDEGASVWVQNENLFSVHGGAGGFVTGCEAYERQLAEGILDLLFSPYFSRASVEPVLPVLGKGLDKILVARLFFSRALWLVTVKNPEQNTGPAKRAFREITMILKKSQHIEHSVLLEDALRTRLALATIGDTSISSVLDNAMDDQFLMRSLKGVYLSVEEMFRALRTVKRVHMLPVTEAPLFTARSPKSIVEFVELEISGPPLTPPWDLPELTYERGLEDRLHEWSRRSVGIWATSFIQWADVIKPGTGNALVVGTGAGGLQRLLMSRGWGSEGLDLSSTIPIEIRQRGSGSPPECALHCPEAKYAQESLFSSGDWFDDQISESVLSRMNPDLVVLDIERQGTRQVLNLLRPLYRYGYAGPVYFSLVCNGAEAGHVYSFLKKSARGIEVYRLSAGDESEKYVKIAFYLQLGSMRNIHVDPTPYVGSFRRKEKYCTPVRPITLRELLPLLCGELARGCNDLQTAHALLLERIEDSKGTRRGKVTSPRFIALLESYAAVHSVMRCSKAKNLSEALSVLAQESFTPDPIKLSFMRYAIKPGRNSDFYSRTLSRVGARMLGIIFA